MREPTLVIMAAGMGSRYGGLKQIDPIDDFGSILMDYSLYDARRAGFRRVVFIIKKELEEDFRRQVADRVARTMHVDIVFQQLDDLPAGFSVPEGRVKPWGTAHALLSVRHIVDGPFAAINADDYYGPHAFSAMQRFLWEEASGDTRPAVFAMAGYQLKNTVTEHGHVARGVCSVSEKGLLTGIREYTRVEKIDGVPAAPAEDGSGWIPFPEDTVVSMNMWGFSQQFLREAERLFEEFLRGRAAEDPLRAEFYIPSVVDAMIREGSAVVRVLPTPDRWFGVTYKEDKPAVMAAAKKMREEGLYPKEGALL